MFWHFSFSSMLPVHMFGPVLFCMLAGLRAVQGGDDSDEDRDLGLRAGLEAVQSRARPELHAFTADQYRGKGHMEYLRKCRESETVKRKHDESCEDHAALGGAWNAQRLRVGDLIEAGMSCDAWNSQIDSSARQHSNSYTVGGVLKNAWKQIGKNKADREGADGSHHQLSFVSVASSGVGGLGPCWGRPQRGRVTSSVIFCKCGSIWCGRTGPMLGPPAEGPGRGGWGGGGVG